MSAVEAEQIMNTCLYILTLEASVVHRKYLQNFYILNKSFEKGLSSQTLNNLRPLRSPCNY